MNTFRHAVRQLTRTPGFTATVVLVLALGVGATTAIFSVVHAVLLHPFPYAESDRLMFIGSMRTGQGMMPVTYPDYLDWSQRSETAAHLAYATGSAATLTDVDEPAVVRNAAVSASAWPLLGVQPTLGRTFSRDEDHPGAERVAVLSHATWQTRFHGDAEILGRAIMLDGNAYTVIGVMPPNFKFWAGDLWTPVGLQADTDMMRSRVLRMDAWVVGRPKADKSVDDLTRELNLIADQLAQQYPESNREIGVTAQLLSTAVTGGFRDPLLILLGAVGFVLLIACANVANLLLARTATRQREYAVRTALGATRPQLIAQMLIECLPLALVGGLAGLLLGIWGLDALLLIIPAEGVPAEADIHVNAPVMLFALGLTLATMILFALIPAIESSRPQVTTALQEGSRGSASRRTGRMRSALIVTEVCLSLTLLVGAGLLIRSFGRLQNVHPGFEAENLLVLPMQLSRSRYPTSDQATQFFEAAVERLKPLPNVRAVAASTTVPFAGGMGLPLLTEGRNYTDLSQLDSVQFDLVTGDFLRAHGLQLVKGRAFTDADRAGSQPVILLNEEAVRRFLPAGDPVGQRVMLGVPPNLVTPGMLPPGFDTFQWSTVVGVVRDVRRFAYQTQAIPSAYIPVRQGWDFLQMRSGMTLMIRTDGDPLRVVPVAREMLTGLDRDQPLGPINSMEMLMSDALQQPRFNTLLLGLFAAVALTLAVVGIYGVVAWNVAQRTKEMGIRLALGAPPAGVLRLVVVQAMRVVAIGVVLGLAVSLAVARMMQNMLFEVSAFDPWTFLVVALVLAASALVACFLPARRATRVDPLTALRAE